jgi:hypothetical protein
MSELSAVGKIKRAMRLAKLAEVGMTLSYFDVIELLGEIESLEETIRILDARDDDALVTHARIADDAVKSVPVPDDLVAAYRKDNAELQRKLAIDICPDYGDIVSELTKEVEKLREKIKQMYKAGTAMYDQIDEVRNAEHQSLDGRDRDADRGWLFATSEMDDEDGEWWWVTRSEHDQRA